MTSAVREPAVAGEFYPGDPHHLRALLRRLLGPAAAAGPAPKALVVPHAGYAFSGPVAASAYALLTRERHTIRRVLLLGPAHWAPVGGLATSSARGFRTPLGVVPLDHDAIGQILTLPQLSILDEAHVPEHSLEVQLPFLQEVLGDFTLVPLLVGSASPGEVAQTIEALWSGPETVVLVSTDLSHYHDYETARAIDTATARAIEALRPEDIHEGQACGIVPLKGLLHVAHKLGLRARTVDLRNSGDTAGHRGRVVGYGAFAFEYAS